IIIRWIMSRKMRTTPEARKKYHENVSNPPPDGRASNPVEIRINVLLYDGPDSILSITCDRQLEKPGNGWCKHRPNHKVGHGNERDNSQHESRNKHTSLILYTLAPEIDHHDTHAVEGMKQHSADQGQGQQAYHHAIEEQNAIVVDHGAEAKQ